MTTAEAKRTMNWTSSDPATLARFARNFLRTCAPNCPLRYKVACRVLLAA